MNNMLLIATAVQIYSTMIESNIDWHCAFEYAVTKLGLSNTETLRFYELL